MCKGPKLTTVEDRRQLDNARLNYRKFTCGTERIIRARCGEFTTRGWNEFARDAAANNRPGAVVGRIILAVVAFALLSGAIQIAIKLAHIA
jgi:hypothetical protein